MQYCHIVMYQLALQSNVRSPNFFIFINLLGPRAERNFANFDDYFSPFTN